MSGTFIWLLFEEEIDLGDSGTMVFRSFDRVLVSK